MSEVNQKSGHQALKALPASAPAAAVQQQGSTAARSVTTQAAKSVRVQPVVPPPVVEPKPIWQFAETNQGLLSLVALVVALIFGLYEYRTNKRAGLVQRREYIAMVSGVIDEMLNFTSDLRARFDSGESFQICAAEWHEKIIAPRFLMDAVRKNAPGDPLLAIEANRLWHSLQLSEHMDAAGAFKARFAEMEANLLRSKAAIRARW